MRASFAALFVILLTTSAFAQSRDSETVIVGRWAIATTYKAEEFESCTMGRSAGELGITFVRERDGLLVVLNSPKWKLNRGKEFCPPCCRFAVSRRASLGRNEKCDHRA
jgi:hypothetical protein